MPTVQNREEWDEWETETQEEVVREKGIYEQLYVAFGKTGIQALIIEQALPELENEADENIDYLIMLDINMPKMITKTENISQKIKIKNPF